MNSCPLPTRHWIRAATFIAVTLFAGFAPAHAQTAEIPTLREMATDRPDKTESPQTVDAGHFQIELDVANYTRDTTGGVRTETVGLAPFNLKYGLGRSTDLQLLVSPYQRQTAQSLSTGAKLRTSGFGDMTIRLKRNIWGNDGGPTALAVMPFVTLPTASANLGAEDVEFGVIVPLSVELSDAIGLGLMTEVDFVRENTQRRANIINSATLGFALGSRAGLYTEIYTERGQDWIVTADTGVTFALDANTQLDAGMNIGLTKAADDLAIFLGVSRRF